MKLAGRLVVSDLSPVQLELNRRHKRDLGLEDRVDDYRVLDLVDISSLAAESFDAVVCIGGALSYLLDQEPVGIRQMLRVLKPGGRMVLGVMSLINTVVRFMGALKAEKDAIGLDNMRWLLETGIRHRNITRRPSITAT